MSRTQRLERSYRVVGSSIAILFFATALFADAFWPTSGRTLQLLLVVLGISWLIFAFLAKPAWQARFYLVLASLLITAGLVEGLFRVAGFDFEHQRRRFEAMPIYFREPNVPLAPVYFRRPGPAEWKGQVLKSAMKIERGDGTAYQDEAEVHVRYDAEGFRNDPALRDWEIAIAGDSFVELGHLPRDIIFTTLVAEQLDRPVKNLGVSRTGTLNQVAFLEKMGVAPSAKHWVIVFFEGNDVTNASTEMQNLQNWEETGEREYRRIDSIKPQSSLFVAAYRSLKSVWREREQTRRSGRHDNAVFAGQASEIPITVSYTPPGTGNLSDEQSAALRAGLSRFAESARSRQIQPWLFYMPCKFRVVYAKTRLAEHASSQFQRWQPSDLPQLLGNWCREEKIEFHDLTPVLEQETEKSQLTFSAIWDSHLNRHGSRVVASEIARQLAPRLAPSGK